MVDTLRSLSLHEWKYVEQESAKIGVMMLVMVHGSMGVTMSLMRMTLVVTFIATYDAL